MPLPSLPPVIALPVAQCADIIRGAVGGVTWQPVLSIAKPAILSVLSRIETGTLLLVDEPGETRHVFGQKLSGKLEAADINDPVSHQATNVPRVELVVKNDAFWMRLFLFADMGFSEAYMLGDFTCEDLTSFFQVKKTLCPLTLQEANRIIDFFFFWYSFSLLTANIWVMALRGFQQSHPPFPV